MRVWPGELDPRDYRMAEPGEQYEGPKFQELMTVHLPDPLDPEYEHEGMRGMHGTGRVYDPKRHAKRNMYERS